MRDLRFINRTSFIHACLDSSWLFPSLPLWMRLHDLMAPCMHARALSRRLAGWLRMAVQTPYA
jgi:hypothetical protein